MGRYLVYITMSFFLSATAQVKHRPFVKTYKNGTKYITCFYLGNLLDSTYTEWSPSGEKKLEGNYKLGKRHGKWTEWHLKTSNYDYTETFYRNGKKDSAYYFIAWPEDSTLKMAKRFTKYGKTVVESEVSWHQNGKQSYEKHFKDYGYDSVSRGWSQEGVLLMEDYYKNGQNHGLSKRWNARGELLSEEYHEHSRLIWRKDYENGILTRERRYDKSGKVLEDKQHKGN